MEQLSLKHFSSRLFEMEKDLKKLFRRLMSVRESGDYVFDSVRLERHATLVMKHLGQAVDNLDDSTYFSELLIMLGEKHSAYDVKPEMLPVGVFSSFVFLVLFVLLFFVFLFLSQISRNLN